MLGKSNLILVGGNALALKTSATLNHAQLRLPDKVCATIGMFVRLTVFMIYQDFWLLKITGSEVVCVFLYLRIMLTAEPICFSLTLFPILGEDTANL